ncbi:MAG: T9SS type A sorting domain-containing protein [Ignavibacteriaceae bacterium]
MESVFHLKQLNFTKKKTELIIRVIMMLLLIQGITMAQLSGSYTIGTGGDYSTLNDAVNALTTQGVSAPVTFNILNGNYNEQILIGNIAGVSSSNTVTFQSQSSNPADVQLTYNAIGTSDNYVIRLDSAKFMIFQNLTLIATGNSYCRVFHLNAPSSDISIINNIILGSTSTGSSDNQTVIFGINSVVNNLHITGNTISDGSYAIYLSGVNTNSKIEGLEIVNNEVSGAYMGIRLNYTEDAKINQNTVQLPGGASYGFYFQNCNGGLEIIKNKILLSNAHGIYLQNSTGGSPPIGSRGLIANNFISTGGGNYGFYISTISNQDFYYNSVNLNSGSNANSRALSVEGNGSGNNFVNNIFVNKGAGYAYYVNTPLMISQSDFNDIYTEGNNFAYWGANVSDLPSLQTASGKDANSISADPLFVSNTNLHTTAQELDSAGTPIARVIDDIDGDLRDANFPDIGADEFIYGFNNSPVITSVPDTLAFVDSLYQYQVIAEDIDGDTLTYNLTTSPEWMSIDSLTGLVEGIPSSNDVGSADVTIMVHDGKGGSVNQIYTVHVQNVTGIESEEQIPEDYIVFQNYPNPFNPSTTIKFGLPENSRVYIDVYSIIGEKVITLMDEEKSAGYYQLQFDAASLASGIYFYRIEAGSFNQIKKMILLK